jgi:hypothetical protein
MLVTPASMESVEYSTIILACKVVSFRTYQIVRRC